MNSCTVTISQTLVHFVHACCHAYKIHSSVSVIHCSRTCIYVILACKSKVFNLNLLLLLILLSLVLLISQTFVKIPYFPAHKTQSACKTHRPIRHTVILSLEILEKNNDDCISILVIYWKKTGLLHTKISNHNIIYSL